MVGTPAARVQRSLSISWQMAAGERSRPGSTSDAPTSADACGRPHELAWNIGTMAQTVSRELSACASARPTARLWSTVLRWL